MSNKFNTIPEALSAMQDGEMIIVVDDPDRENEGDLIMAAEKVTAERINFMARFGRGLICLPTCSERLDELELYPMVASNTAQMQTAFTVTIDAKEVTTGISAQERAYTIQKFVDPNAEPADFVRPGHIFPLEAKPGGGPSTSRAYRSHCRFSADGRAYTPRVSSVRYSTKTAVWHASLNS